MQCVEKGDVIIVVVHYGAPNLVDACIATEYASPKDMTDTRAIINTNKSSGGYSWAIGPADLHLRGAELGDLAYGLSKKVIARVKKRGYWWELRARVQVPLRTLEHYNFTTIDEFYRTTLVS